MTSPLAGIRVVESTSWMAAPSAAVILADMGADVIKIEPLRGDAMRGMIRPPKVPEGADPIDASFAIDNRGKRSLALALDKPEGAEIARKLIADADVFICNLLPHRQAKYGLDPESLKTINPKLVHATLTGYGIGGPDEQRPGVRCHGLLWTWRGDRHHDGPGRYRAPTRRRPRVTMPPA